MFTILKETIPISMARITNQIVCVRAFLTNFMPALVPLPQDSSDSDVEEYFKQLSACDSESDGDSDIR